MDCNDREKSKINPEERANILSSITFLYTLGIFKKGYKKKLEEDDIYQVLNKLNSKKLGDYLEEQWNQEEKKQENPSIYRLLWKCFGKTYLFIGLVQLMMRTIMIIYTPLAIEKLVSYFKHEQKDLTKGDAYFYAGLFIVLNIINSVYLHNYLLVLAKFGISIRTGFCSLIYRKCLTLSSTMINKISMGKIVTLITKDVRAFEMIVIYGNDIWIGFVQAGIACFLIYQKIGVSAFVGVGFFLLVLPIQIIIGKKATRLRMKAAKKTDERLQIMQKTLSAIKIIKIYTWEKFVSKKISDARKKEVRSIVKIFFTKVIILLIGALTSKLAFYLLIMTYIWLGNLIDAGLIYYILICFARLRHALSNLIPMGITEAAELYASVNRIGDILKLKNPKYPVKERPIICPKVKMENVTVEINGLGILKNISLRIDPGLTVLTGPIGGGKTTFLRTILRDYILKEGNIVSHGIVSYASQEPWIFPSTIKQNIVFGEELNQERYLKVVQVCALKPDLLSLEKQDMTIIGDKGINLSKGQQCRINLARAIYRNADIYLLDDCLSSLDANVRNYVFKNCIKGFLKDKLVILVTQDQQFIKLSENIILMEEGKIKSHTKSINIKEHDLKFITDEQILNNNTEKLEVNEDKFTEDMKLLIGASQNLQKNIYHEKKREGKVKKATYNQYIRMGGGYFILFLVMLCFVLNQTSKSYTEKMVSTWVNLEENISNYKLNNLTDPEKYSDLMDQHIFISIEFSIVVFLTTFLSILTACCLFNFTRKASNRLHDRMVENVIEATMDFFDHTFIGNILNRCSKDLSTIDETLPFVIYEFVDLSLTLFGIIILIASVSLIFLIPTLIFTAILFVLRKLYLPTGRNLQRLDAATRSPVIGYLNASMEGLTTIKAYGVQKMLIDQFDKHQDLYTSTNYLSRSTARAFGFFLDMFCIVYLTAIIGRFLLIDSDTSVGDVGLAISQSASLTGVLQYAIRMWADLENQMTSVERVIEYSDVKKENRLGLTLGEWPIHGKIRFENVSLFYRGEKQVLNCINFDIKANEKVGIVGRTGAGKTSLISCLLRLYPIEGKIEIDGVDTKLVSLDVLRKNISIIPQDPVLFSGTIRSNIDPTGAYEDHDIWGALQKVQFDVQSLDDKIENTGSNYSAGQKQLICLARSIISKNRIIILDEATANMDDTTDRLIRSALKEHFSSCTIITIAHNLESVLNCNRVMVIDNGMIVEYDNPCYLIGNKNSVFRGLMETAGILDKILDSTH